MGFSARKTGVGDNFIIFSKYNFSGGNYAVLVLLSNIYYNIIKENFLKEKNSNTSTILFKRKELINYIRNINTAKQPVIYYNIN